MIVKIGQNAISPMIATVLLIAFTVAVGGILSMWLTSLASTQTETTGSAAEVQILCARSVLTIDEVDYYKTNSSNITISYPYGTENLTAINIYFINSTRASINKSQTGTRYSISPGEIKTFPVATDLNPSANVNDVFQSVKVIALCQSTYPVSGECKTGQSCMAKRAS